MGDGLKLSKDKRHRSSSSLAGAGVEGTRSERKLDIRALIPEVDDHFALAEARCNELQEKIDVVKVLKRKKKLNKRSVTRLNEHPTVTENMPFISVHTQPKKKTSPQVSRMRRVEVPPHPTRGYLDPATVEQHRMLGQVWGYGHNYKQNTEYPPEPKTYSRTQARQTHADGDGMYGQSVKTPGSQTEVACGREYDIGQNRELFGQNAEEFTEGVGTTKQNDNLVQGKTMPAKRTNYSRDLKDVPKWIDSSIDNARGPGRTLLSFRNTRRQANNRRRPQEPLHQQNVAQRRTVEDQSVVELFNKSRIPQKQALLQPTSTLDRTKPTPTGPKKQDRQTKRPRDNQKCDDHTTVHSKEVLLSESKQVIQYPAPRRRVRYRSHRYEMPTVASQMKQAEIRYNYAVANGTNIPFVVTKSTAPSHNIGVNIQQVLNGLKIKQPLNGIPLTIAHHMGLGHVPSYGTKSVTNVRMRALLQQPSLDNREINAIKLGERLLLLPSYKYISYNRMLALYREGDGMVPRFLRAISRPNYCYTSMYNLATNREELENGTLKGSTSGRKTKRELAEYSSLYREYEQVERRLKEGDAPPEVELRRDVLLRELASREKYIRKLVENPITAEDSGDFNMVNLHASASTANNSYRQLNSKHNAGDQRQ